METMLRVHLLQVWFTLSGEGVVYDSYATPQTLRR